MSAVTETEAMPYTMSREDAERLTERIRTGISNVERDLLEFIRGQGWKALGYRNFQAYWDDRLDGLRLTTVALTAAVVAAIYDGTGSVEATQVALRNSAGIMPNTIKKITQQLDAGTPVKAIKVRGHDRAPATPSAALRVQFGDPEDLWQVRAIFEAHQLKLEVEALRLIKAEARRLERKGRGRD